MRTQVTRSELLKLSAILIFYVLAVVHVGFEGTVSAQDPTNPLAALAHTQQAQLTASDGTPGDNFGNAVAISNNTAVVGAVRQPSQANRGAAYVFVRNGTSWSEQQRLLPADVVNGDVFGTSVAIDGDTIVAGAPAKSIGTAGRGAAYVFVRTGTTWTQQQQLTASDGAMGDNFGTAVAVSGDTIVVGALNHAVGANSRQGAAYIFVRSGSNWTEQQKVTASDGLASDQLGGSVALIGDTAVVGARENNFGANRNGKVYVFLRSGTTWSQQQKLTASGGSALDAFGGSVGISHNVDTIAIGAPDDDEAGVTNRGSVYVFVRSGTTWSEQQRLLGSLGLASGSNAHFGASVDVDGDTIIAGAPELDPNEGGNGRGAVYLFDRTGSTWAELQRFLLPPVVLREFGCSVSLSGDSFIGGARFDTVGSNLGQGSAYVFSTGKTLSISGVNIAEGDSGTTQATFTVTLSAPETAHVVLNYATTDGTATAGSDYVAASEALTFNPGETSKTLTVTINGDTAFETDETFFVDLSNPVNANLLQARGTGTLTNDDPPPSISINDVSQAEGNSGTTNFTFTVTLSAVSGLPATVNYATADGTASAVSDYQSTSGTLTFDPGQPSKQITVAVNGDAQNEADETFLVNLSSPTNSTIAKAQGVGTIVNDDPPLPIVQFSAANYNAQEDCTFVTVTVNRIGTPLPAGTVDYFTSDVTANGRRDYIAAIGKLRFAAGETSKSFPLLINEDSYLEGVETFNVNLTNPSGVMLGAPSLASVTIADDATEPATNAIDDPRNFAGQHYHDFLNRQPDQSGWDFWTNETASCGTNQQCLELKRIFVSAAFYISIEFQETGYLVERLFKTAYGDAMGNSTFGGAHQLPVPIVRFNEFFPDTQEISQGVVVGAPGWEQQLENNKVALVSEFVQRTRFTAAFPTMMTPAQFVNQLSTNAGNVLSTSERATAIALFGGAANTTNMTARAQALRHVAEDQNLRNAEFNRAFVLMQYFGYLRRDPNDQPDTDYSGFDFWLTKLNQFNGNFVQAEMVKAFIISGEYRQRFGPTTLTPPGGSAFKLLPTRLGLAIDDENQLLALNPSGPITWSSSNPAVVTVDALGKLKALSKGSAIITAASGTDVATSTLTVYRTEGANPDPSTEVLIATALEQNRISAEQALMYRIFALFGDERLPREFDGSPSDGPSHLLLRELAATIASLSSSTQEVLRPFLVPPIYAESWYAQRLGLPDRAPGTPDQLADAATKTQLAGTVNCDPIRLNFFYTRVSTEHFNIFYLKFGDPTMDGQSAAVVALIASLVEEVYDAETMLLDRVPKPDTNEDCNGGDGRYDLYYGPFALFGTSAWTTTYPLAPELIGQNECANRPSYTMLNKISLEFSIVARSPEDARLMVKSILAHEFLHALQFGMNRQATCEDIYWIDEATAQWAMDYVVPSIPAGLPGEYGMEPGLVPVANFKKSGKILADYLYSGHMVSIEEPGDEPKFNGYSDYLFFQFLARKQSPTKIKQIYDAMVGGLNSVEAVAAVVDLKSVWPEFAKSLWIGFDDHVLDYWATEDEYRFGLAQVYAGVPTSDIPQRLKDRLKSLKIDQRGNREAKFELLQNAILFSGDGDYEIEPRSIHYEHLKFTDPTVHYVTFFNPIAEAFNNDFMKVQAVTKINGQWNAPEDWTSDLYKLFCLDKKDERLEELIIIVSNSEANRGAEVPFRIPADTPMLVSTSNVGCWRWEGTASLTTNTIEGPVTVESATNVTFDRFRLPFFDPDDTIGFDLFKSSNAGTASYRISGTVLATGCTVSGMASGPLQGDGELIADGNIVVNFLLPGTEINRIVIGTGVTNIPSVTTTVTCPSSPPGTSTSYADVRWLSFGQQGVSVSADGQTISGRRELTDGEGAKTWVWNFRSVREQ